MIYSTAPLKFARFINGGDWGHAPGYFKDGLEALAWCDHPLRQDLEDYLIRVVDGGQPEVETN
ncbi:MAG: hypothetical protein AAGH17_11165 [Pseudomonadota bacterium]